MAEIIWDNTIDPEELLRIVFPPQARLEQITDDFPAQAARRLRLFAIACARQVWHLLPTDYRSTVLTTERYVEGRASERELIATRVPINLGAFTFRQHACNTVSYATNGISERPLTFSVRGIIAPTSQSAAKAIACREVGPAPSRDPTNPKWHGAWCAKYAEARLTQAEFVRDIFPPPGPAIVLDPQWLSSTVLAMAKTMYQSGDFSAVPILGDALEDAGCSDNRVLEHCRHPGPHVRGNWVVDLLLEKQ